MKDNGPLVLGSMGRVGRALASVWPASASVLWHGRAAPAPYVWDMTSQAPELPAGITGIIVLAGATTGDADALAVNTSLALAACDLAQRAGGLRVLLASSQAVYGRPVGPATEDMIGAPDTPYGHAKLAMERAVADRPNVTCLRIGNIAGCDGLLGPAARKGHVSLDRFPDGQAPRRAYVGPVVFGDILRGLLAHGAALPPVLNIAQPGLVSMADMLAAADIPWDWQPAGPNALPALEMDCTRLTDLLPVPIADAQGLVAQARAAGWAVL